MGCEAQSSLRSHLPVFAFAFSGAESLLVLFICSSVMKFNSLQNDLSLCRSPHFRWDSSISISEQRSGWRTHSTLSWDLGDVLTPHWAEIWVTHSLRTELGSGWLTHLRHDVFRVCTLNIFSWVLRFRKGQSFVKLNIKHSSYELNGMKSRVLFLTLVILTELWNVKQTEMDEINSLILRQKTK